MTLTRKLALALCLVFSFITLSSKAQTAGTIDPTTGNLITSNWSGTTPASGYGGYSGGYQPGYISNQNAIVFGYSQGTASQSIGIANALAASGSGIEVKGYTYSWYYYNNDMNRGNLSGTISLRGSTGNVLESYNYNMPQLGIGNWIQQSGSQLFTNQYQIGQLSTLDVSFTGKDDRFWAGYYGPAIKAVNVKLSYGVNPCATNPAYSPNCEGFDKVLTSSNLVPNPGSYAYGGWSLDQSYAINTALATAGSAAQIHGFKWGYVANANGPYCGSWDLGIFGCLDTRNPYVNTNVSITDSAGATLYSVNRHYENSYNTTSYSYLFPSSKTMSTLGNFNFTATTNDQAYIGSVWSTALYTVDPCVANPLSSPSCSGYAAALIKTLPTTTSTTTTAYVGTTSVTPSSQVETSPAGVIDQTSPTTSQTTSTTSTASTASTTTQESTQTAAAPTADPAQPASTTPTPAGGPAQTTATASSTSSSSSSSSPSSAGPSKLAMSVLKSAQEKDKATQAAAVQSAAKTLENATQNSQASSNAAISMNQDMSANSAVAAATFASQTTQASMQAAVQPGQMQQAQQSQSQQSSRTTQQTQQAQQDTQQTQVTGSNNGTQVQQAVYVPPVQQETQSSVGIMLRPPTQASFDIPQQSSTGIGLTLARNPFAYSPLSSLNSSNLAMTQPAPTTYQFRNETRSVEVETPQPQVANFSGAGKPGNPLSELMMQQKFELMQSNIEQQKSSVNRNVQTNEAAAGGVSLTAMAVVPVGFNTYSFIIKDAAFYEPKEVYKNQKTVDNVRILRGLTGGSDAKHKEMVDSQYK